MVSVVKLKVTPIVDGFELGKIIAVALAATKIGLSRRSKERPLNAHKYKIMSIWSKN